METTIARYIADVLSAHQLKRFFTIPGSSCISLNDALNRKGILPVLSRSEESATHSAHGYAAMTDTFGCAVVSRGPAATNTITGLVTASEGYPVLVIVGDNASTVRQKNMATQDLPLENIFDGVCDHATITNPAEAETSMHRLLDKLVNQKKSCVLIVPSDMWNEKVSPTEYHKPPQVKAVEVNATALSDALQELPKTDNNVLLIGVGILNNPFLRMIAENMLKKYEVPFVVSTRGIGYPSPQRVGWVGILSEPEANDLLYRSEHIVILDESLETATTGSLIEFRKGRKITNISLTTDGQAGFEPDHDIRIKPHELSMLLELLFRKLKFMRNITENKSPNKPKPEIILAGILEQLPDEYAVCLDSGQNFFWGAHALVKTNKHRIIYSYTQATMGFGLPALVGVSSIHSRALLICGDGGFLMASEELSTMYSAGFEGKVIILNNSMLGMIYQTQKIKKIPKLAVDIKVHDLQKVVEGYGWEYVSTDGFDAAIIKRFLESKNNCVLNIQLDQNESVYPRGGTSERLPTV